MIHINFTNNTQTKIHISALEEVVNLFNSSFSALSDTAEFTLDVTTSECKNGFISLCTSLGYENVCVSSHNSSYASKLSVYKMLKNITKHAQPWGSLTGVKPLKLLVKLKENGLSDDECEKYIKDNFDISDEKLNLLFKTLDNNMSMLYPKDEMYCMYIHIPMCLSKCSYCSFPSAVTDIGSDLCEEYLNALIKELKAVTNYFKPLKADCLYVGGGTPSILSTPQIKRFLSSVKESCPDITELTFEAGRADTLDYEKLKALKDGGVTRISLNPQTTNNKTLLEINRKASYEDFLSCFKMCREVGFDNINCDIIYGLSDETKEDFDKSLNDIINTSCESITLHTLCKKRTSEILLDELNKKELPIAEYMNSSCDKLIKNGYEPYYLYRQKNALDNSENTGYVKPGYGCIYNVRMMGEMQSVISAGAASTTKIYFADEDRFENVYNIKNIRMYIDNIDDVIQKKLSHIDKILKKEI